MPKPAAKLARGPTSTPPSSCHSQHKTRHTEPMQKLEKPSSTQPHNYCTTVSCRGSAYIPCLANELDQTLASFESQHLRNHKKTLIVGAAKSHSPLRHQADSLGALLASEEVVKRRVEATRPAPPDRALLLPVVVKAPVHLLSRLPAPAATPAAATHASAAAAAAAAAAALGAVTGAMPGAPAGEARIPPTATAT
eukprot:CAMPEP_0206229660 /NCGR_PEP_ID=MMETSP0047_2-20121206/9821_1 /ASSEMBLY_ACC=CAM_ASM_000192 /TAXON_ID=195065 /ORGANISM="Chroomonas mesostigmatica_cf, Strain CCMP1168" /LENGTH=194 /DNA_ID=CAMNT_0053652985 /DNA_START=185 /DNA_END=766 /DNA_ORIENTATION=-